MLHLLLEDWIFTKIMGFTSQSKEWLWIDKYDAKVREKMPKLNKLRIVILSLESDVEVDILFFIFFKKYVVGFSNGTLFHKITSTQRIKVPLASVKSS